MEEPPRQISENKIHKNEEVQCNVIKNRIAKRRQELSDELKHNALIVGDSKVRHIEQQMSAKTNLSSFWRSGAILSNDSLNKHIDRHIARFRKPIVILLFNTCYLTTVTNRETKYIDLVSNSDDIVNIVIEKYREFKQRRLLIKPSTRIIFLECPFYSIVEWNRRMKHPQPETFEISQNKLELMITDLNIKIKQLNEPLNLPQIAQDMIVKIIKKRITSKPEG